MEPKNRLNDDEHKVNVNIDRVRARPFRFTDDKVTLQHGAGGKASAALVENIFYSGYGNDHLEMRGDAAVVPTDVAGGTLAFSTDSYVVNPIEFSGGSIGDLAVNGTVNDLAVSGAIPTMISVPSSSKKALRSPRSSASLQTCMQLLKLLVYTS